MNRTEIEEKVKAFLIDDLEIDEEKIAPEANCLSVIHNIPTIPR